MNELDDMSTPKKDSLLEQQGLSLHTAPSFSAFNTNEVSESDDDASELEQGFKRTVTIGESIHAMGSRSFSFGMTDMDLIEETPEMEENANGFDNLSVNDEDVEPRSPPMYLAAGLGMDEFVGGFDSGNYANLPVPNFDEGGNAEEFYRTMVDEYPCHPLFLRNYAQILQSKGDLHGAEEYYIRATLANPNDGEIWMQYAKLVWELHHDKNKALNHYEHAVQLAPQDSDILAAYASFLWEIEEEEIGEYQNGNKQSLETANLTPYNDREEDLEGYYMMKIDENPTDPLLLRTYAWFLFQSKHDLSKAEEYYSSAISVDPGNGEIMSEYAQLIWELHQDKNKSSSYFQQALQSTPENSNVLAAYARFLWEAGSDEEVTE